MSTTISKHFTKKGAEEHAKELNFTKLVGGRSSGWTHFDYVVKRSTSVFRKWRVVTRHVR